VAVPGAAAGAAAIAAVLKVAVGNEQSSNPEL